MENVVLANDHGAVELRPRVITHLEKRGYRVKDLGVKEAVSVDYPDRAAEAVAEFRKGGYRFGILMCGTGIGISIAANKYEGIRCALPFDAFTARMAREHNDANFIALGGRSDYPVPVEAILDAYIDAVFAGGRHQTRVDKLAGPLR
jgi:ribose 5-phosphate isomerase B